MDRRTPAQLRELVAERVAKWSPAVSHLIAVTDPATIAPVSLRTMPQLTAWAPSDVTLLGDAIHNMTPMAGIGANTALRDADELLRVGPAARERRPRPGPLPPHSHRRHTQAMNDHDRAHASACHPKGERPRKVSKAALGAGTPP